MAAKRIGARDAAKSSAASPATPSLTRWRERERAFLFRRLATLRTDIDLFEPVDPLKLKGPIPAFAPFAARLEETNSSATAV